MVTLSYLDGTDDVETCLSLLYVNSCRISSKSHMD